MRTLRPALVDAAPVAAAFAVFGVIYGATASETLGPVPTVASSALMFSGAAQFTMVALAGNGASAAALVLAVTLLNLRHVPLAAIVRARLPASRARRAILALGLTDETAGLAVVSRRPVAATVAVVGSTAFLAWVAGTAAGVAGADLAGVEPVAGAVFVVLFIGLASLTSRTAGDRRRAAGAAVATAFVLALAPGAGAPAAMAVALVVAARAGGSIR